MSNATVLQTIQSFCYRVNIPAPDVVYGSTSPAQLQYLELFKFIGDMLKNKPFQWPQLKRQWFFLTQTNVRNYPYPGDFYRLLESTPFDASNQRPMRGAISDYNYAIRTQAVVSLQTRKAYQIIGKTSGIIHSRTNNEFNVNTDGYFRIDPPGADELDLCSLAYISRNWVLPPNWAPSTIVSSSDNIACNVNGNIYICETSGTTGTFPPTMTNGIGTDGGTLWMNIIFSDTLGGGVWGASTQYTAGQYVFTAGGKYYSCVTGGQSGLSAPTGTSDSVTDGTVVWEYLTVSAWAANTTYSYNDYVTQTVAGHTQLFMNISLNAAESVSGTVPPCWYWSAGYWYTVDNTAVWLWDQTEYAVTSDSDLCLFDKDLMVEGMRWAWFRAKKQDYQQERSDWDQQVKSSFARFDGPIRISMSDEMGDFDNWPNVPTGSWNVDG